MDIHNQQIKKLKKSHKSLEKMTNYIYDIMVERNKNSNRCVLLPAYDGCIPFLIDIIIEDHSNIKKLNSFYKQRFKFDTWKRTNNNNVIIRTIDKSYLPISFYYIDESAILETEPELLTIDKFKWFSLKHRKTTIKFIYSMLISPFNRLLPIVMNDSNDISLYEINKNYLFSIESEVSEDKNGIDFNESPTIDELYNDKTKTYKLTWNEDDNFIFFKLEI